MKSFSFIAILLTFSLNSLANTPVFLDNFTSEERLEQYYQASVSEDPSQGQMSSWMFYKIANSLVNPRYRDKLSLDEKIAVINHARIIGFDLIDDPNNKKDSYKVIAGTSPVCQVFRALNQKPTEVLQLVKAMANDRSLDVVKCSNDTVMTWAEKNYGLAHDRMKNFPTSQQLAEELDRSREVLDLVKHEVADYNKSLSNHFTVMVSGEDDHFELTEGIEVVFKNGIEHCPENTITEDIHFMARVLRANGTEDNRALLSGSGNCMRNYYISSGVELNSETKAELFNSLKSAHQSGGIQ